MNNPSLTWRRRRFLETMAAGLGLGLANSLVGCSKRSSRELPNILLAISDDQGRDYAGCYGDPVVRTPTQDQLAQEGVRFTQAFVASPQCSPSRSAIYTGKAPHTTGTERLHTPLKPDEFIFTDALKRIGYKTCVWEKWHLGKAKYIGDPIGDLAGNQPFFYQLGYHEPHRVWRHERIYDPDEVKVPPYLPDTPAVREDLAGYLSDITWMDAHLGRFLERLEDAGIRERTVVIFAGDNGLPFPRAKATLYDPGIIVPLIISWPGLTKPGTVSDALVSFIDLAPTILSALDLAVPEDTQGHSLIPLFQGKVESVNEVIFAERNWHDHEDTMRAVRSRRYKYIRNFMADTPYKPSLDLENSPTWKEIVRLRKAGKLPPPLDKFYSGKPRPEEELYDLETDPWEFNNLAAAPEKSEIKAELREKLRKWMVDTKDKPELIQRL